MFKKTVFIDVILFLAIAVMRLVDNYGTLDDIR